MWITIAIIAIVIAAIVIAIAVLSKTAQGSPLIEAVVTTTNGSSYSVVYKRLNSEAKPVEWVWLCILFPAKMLFIIGNESKQLKEKERFLTTLMLLGSAEWASGNDVKRIVGRPISTSEKTLTGKEIRAVIGYKDIMTRTIFTTIPSAWFESQFHDSWIALLITSTDNLDEFHRNLLRGAITKMAQLYHMADTSSLESMIVIPQQAFHERHRFATPLPD